ncbi:MAG TPA: NADH:flavin oxidoreductase [Kofleriaceae bacterium]|nr:NADH:flavin oxidoreductase [Kofleriaceae bacterium]
MLNEPLALRSGLVIPNRVALAAMTNGQSHPDGTLADEELRWLERRAEGGFGLVCTCAAYVAKDGKAWDGELGVDSDADVPGLTRLAAAIKRHGATAFVQLFHGGVRATQRLTGAQVWSASVFQEDAPDFETPRAATEADLGRTIEAFAAAAERCQRAGFDGVELHGAHGYLLTQFISAVTNTRTDAWGGSLEHRARLVREVTRAVRARCGAAFSVGVRLSLEHGGSARGLDLDESLQISRWLADDGVDFIHASLWRAENNTRKRPDEHPIPLVRAALPKDVALIVAGNIWTFEDAAAARERGADMVALARPAIVNPDWPKQAQPGWEPRRPPLTRAELEELAVSPAFAVYLRHFKNLVSD